MLDSRLRTEDLPVVKNGRLRRKTVKNIDER